MSGWLPNRVKAFGYAFRGIGLAFRTQAHIRIHAVAVAALVALGLWTGLAPWEWTALLICMGLVIALELINSALEALCDRVTREHDPLIGMAKDMAAGAVLVSVLFAAAVWAVIFVPKWG